MPPPKVNNDLVKHPANRAEVRSRPLSGRQDHWTDRVAAQLEDPVDDAPYVPNKVVKKVRFKLK